MTSNPPRTAGRSRRRRRPPRISDADPASATLGQARLPASGALNLPCPTTAAAARRCEQGRVGRRIQHMILPGPQALASPDDLDIGPHSDLLQAHAVARQELTRADRHFAAIGEKPAERQNDGALRRLADDRAAATFLNGGREQFRGAARPCRLENRQWSRPGDRGGIDVFRYPGPQYRLNEPIERIDAKPAVPDPLGEKAAQYSRECGRVASGRLNALHDLVLDPAVNVPTLGGSIDNRVARKRDETALRWSALAGGDEQCSSNKQGAERHVAAS